jgi:hypothetical protein
MTRTGPTRRNLGNIWMWVSACVLLIPPLVIAADVVVLGFSQPNGAKPEGAARRTAASQATVTESVSIAEQTDGVTSFALASAEQHAVITEQHSVAGRRPMTAATEQRPISGQPTVAKDPSRYDALVPVTASGQPAATKDPTRYYGPIPVTLLHVWKSREQSAMADIEAAHSTVTAAHGSLVATRIHASYASRRIVRHEPRTSYRAKQLNKPRQMAGVAGRSRSSGLKIPRQVRYRG